MRGLVLAALLLLPLPVSAQGFNEGESDGFPSHQWAVRMFCADIGNFDGYLRKRHRQAPFIRGLTLTGEVFQVYRDKEGYMWALTLVFPDGKECLVFGGEALEDVPWILGKDYDPT